MSVSKQTNYKIAVSTSAAEQVFTNTEPKIVKVIADNAVTHMKLTPASSSSDATTSDYLLPNGSEVEFSVGRGLDRISAITSAGSGNIYVSVLE
jgi:hypothetical protein